MPARQILPRFALGAAILAGCGAPRSTAPPPAAGDPCLISDHAVPRRDTLRVALLTPVAATSAPAPTTDGERLVFRQLYETLVRVDCAGVVRPGLAARWRTTDGTEWRFDLRPDARFWDGTPVGADALRAAWRDTPGVAFGDVHAVGSRAIVVSFAAPRPIEAFGDAAWGVVKRIPESPWPVGTGPVWVDNWDDDGGTPVLRAVPTPAAPIGTPVVEFRGAAASESRDVLDQTADVVVTRDAGAVRYAVGRGDWRDVPLPWDRVYLLASPVRLRSGTTAQLDSAALAALARDAVRDDARPPEPHRWWADPPCAPDLAGPTTDARAAGVPFASVLAPADDRVATDLVARLVARPDAELGRLLGTDAGGLRAGPLDPADFAAQLTAGHAPAFVLALPRRPLDGCRASAHLRARAPWLRAPEARWADALAPLVETRAHLLLRRVAAVELDRDGAVRLVPRRAP